MAVQAQVITALNVSYQRSILKRFSLSRYPWLCCHFFVPSRSWNNLNKSVHASRLRKQKKSLAVSNVFLHRTMMKHFWHFFVPSRSPMRQIRQATWNDIPIPPANFGLYLFRDFSDMLWSALQILADGCLCGKVFPVISLHLSKIPIKLVKISFLEYSAYCSYLRKFSSCYESIWIKLKSCLNSFGLNKLSSSLKLLEI